MELYNAANVPCVGYNVPQICLPSSFLAVSHLKGLSNFIYPLCSNTSSNIFFKLLWLNMLRLQFAKLVIWCCPSAFSQEVMTVGLSGIDPAVETSSLTPCLGASSCILAFASMPCMFSSKNTVDIPHPICSIIYDVLIRGKDNLITPTILHNEWTLAIKWTASLVK